MHPIASHQIAILRASELHRQAARHNAHARRRPAADAAGTAPARGSSLLRVWAVLVRRLGLA